MQSKIDAFIQYSRNDKFFASTLERLLEAYVPPKVSGEGKKRLDVFRDEGEFTGSEYDNAIQNHLEQLNKLTVIFSPEACSSDFVNDEIKRFAAIHGRNI